MLAFENLTVEGTNSVLSNNSTKIFDAKSYIEPSAFPSFKYVTKIEKNTEFVTIKLSADINKVAGREPIFVWCLIIIFFKDMGICFPATQSVSRKHAFVWFFSFSFATIGKWLARFITHYWRNTCFVQLWNSSHGNGLPIKKGFFNSQAECFHVVYINFISNSDVSKVKNEEEPNNKATIVVIVVIVVIVIIGGLVGGAFYIRWF